MKVPGEQIEVELGCRVIDSVTDLYSAFDPNYQHAATVALAAVINAVIEHCPAAFSGPSSGSENPYGAHQSNASNESE